MDLTSSIAVDSSQLNADDLVGGPMTVTVREVVKGRAEQPFDFMLMETDRAYRPNKTMRRLIVAAWGPETNTYGGRRLTLYREPSIRFGKDVTGGIRISHMSDLTKPLEEKFQTTRGKRETFVVKPLAAAPKPPDTSHLDRLLAAFDVAGVAGVARLGYCSQLLGRPVSSPGDLTPADVDRLVTALEADGGGE